MFGFFSSPDAKMRETAAHWLEIADKVLDFRSDVMPATAGALLRTQTELLRRQVKEKAAAVVLKSTIETLEEMLQKNGGAIYPKSALVENVEFLLVAAIVIIGIRTYFVQPFKIPTNSMWPTYNGMTAQVYERTADEPGPLAVAARAVAFGAWPHRLDAPVDGEILVPLGGLERRDQVHCRIVPGRTWLVLPTQLREYTLLVGDRPVTVRLPLDFDFDWVVGDTFFDGRKSKEPGYWLKGVSQKIAAREYEDRMVDGQMIRCVRTGHFVKAGERILSFDEVTGDQLFVDRISFNFMRPVVGQGFVFWTGNIHSEHMQDSAGNQIEQYYIKRLVGSPGDTLEIHEPMIFRNGRPITGSTAFEMNAKREGQYAGYFNGPMRARFLTSDDSKVQIPADNYFAMGDNSGHSADSRYWGFVPAKDVIGRPLFIYFPLSRHWGPAR